MSKARCDCGWTGDTEQLLSATSPFDPDDTIFGCPQCKTIADFPAICQAPGCWDAANCGFPHGDGYFVSCSRHFRDKGWIA